MPESPDKVDAPLEAAPAPGKPEAGLSAAQTFAQQYEVEAISEEAPSPAHLPEPEEDRGGSPPASPKRSHPASLVRMALDYGFSDEEIASRPTDALGEDVYRIQRKTLELARQASAEREVARATEKPPPSAAPEQISAGDAAAGDELGLDEADWDPRLIGLFKRQQAEIKALKEKITFVDNREQARQNESVAERVDRKFVEHKHVLGEGRRHELAKDSAEYARRLAVLGMVDRDTSHRSLEEKIDRAIDVLYGKAPATSPAPTPELSRQQRLWADGGVARPTNRAAEPEPPGPRKARRSVAEKLREMQQDVSQDNGEADEGDFLGGPGS